MARGRFPLPTRTHSSVNPVVAFSGGPVHNLQTWVISHSPQFTGGNRLLVLIVVIGVVLLVSLAVLLERQRPARRVSRARHPETIPTWGDMYLNSLAEAHSKPHRPHRMHRNRISTP